MSTGPVVRLMAVCGYLVLLSPLAVVALLSVSSGTFLTFPPPGLSLRWFTALAGNADILSAARNSAVLAVLVTLIALLAGFPAAVAIARERVPGWVSLLISAPLLLPTLVIGLALLITLQPVGLVATWPGLALAHIVVVLPFVVRVMVSSLQALTADMEEAAATLGAAPLRAFLRITLPLAMPGVLAAATLAFLVSFDETVISLFMVGPRLTTLPVALFHYTESRTDPLVAALAVSLVAISVGVIALVDRLIGFTRAIGRVQ
jgi:putative spermidine/putrescine transport system permease protein